MENVTFQYRNPNIQQENNQKLVQPINDQPVTFKYRSSQQKSSDVLPLSVGKSIGSTIGGLGADILAGAASIPEIPAKVLSFATGLKPNNPFISERIASKREELFGKPESFGGKVASSVAHGLPATLGILALTGGSAAPAIAADVAGSIGSTAVEKLTDNPIARFLGDITARKSFNSLYKSINNLKNVPEFVKSLENPNKPVFETIKNKLYKDQEELGKSFTKSTKSFNDSMVNFKKSVEDMPELSKAQVKDVFKNIDRVIKKIEPDKLNGDDFYNIKKFANGFFKQPNLTSSERKVYLKLNNVIKENLEKVGAGYPGWVNSWKAADEIHGLGDWKSNLSNWVKSDLIDPSLKKVWKNPVVYASLGQMLGIPVLKSLGLAAVGAKLTKESASLGKKYLNVLMNDTYGKEIINDLIVSAAKNNSSGLIKSFKKLDHYTEKNKDDFK